MRRWPLPQPLPRREGRNMWGYPYKTASKGHNEAYVLFIGVSRWSLPFPSGEGSGEGPLSFCPLCVLFFCDFLWEKDCWILAVGSFSLTERTEFTEPFGAHFELTEGLRHTEFTEAFQLRLAVTLCDIGWLNVSVEPCVFCSSVFFCEK